MNLPGGATTQATTRYFYVVSFYGEMYLRSKDLRCDIYPKNDIHLSPVYHNFFLYYTGICIYKNICITSYWRNRRYISTFFIEVSSWFFTYSPFSYTEFYRNIDPLNFNTRHISKCQLRGVCHF